MTPDLHPQTENGNGNGSTNPGIGVPTATTDPGVRIGNTTWATRNVNTPGTFADYPHSFGMFYQWNRNVAWSATYPDESVAMPNWDNTMPTGTEWEVANDPCPPGWQVPSFDQIQELSDTADQGIWTSNHNSSNVTGRILTAGDNVLFLPAVGLRYRDDGSLLYYQGEYGFYWSSTLSEDLLPFYLFFNHNGIAKNDDDSRFGLSVRCVAVE